MMSSFELALVGTMTLVVVACFLGYLKRVRGMPRFTLVGLTLTVPLMIFIFVGGLIGEDNAFTDDRFLVRSIVTCAVGAMGMLGVIGTAFEAGKRAAAK